MSASDRVGWWLVTMAIAESGLSAAVSRLARCSLARSLNARPKLDSGTCSPGAGAPGCGRAPRNASSYWRACDAVSSAYRATCSASEALWQNVCTEPQ